MHQQNIFVRYLVSLSLLCFLLCPAPVAQAKTSWNLATMFPPNHYQMKPIKKVAGIVKERTGGEFTINIYPGSTLLKSTQTLDGVAQGIADAGYVPSVYWVRKNQAFTAFSAMVDFYPNQYLRWLQAAGESLIASVYARQRVVGMPCSLLLISGILTTSPLASIADLHGLKLRTHSYSADVLKKAGGRPVFMPMPELYEAMKRGVVDGALGVSAANGKGWRLDEAAKYFYSGWPPPFTTVDLIVNQQAWQSLPDNYKRILAQACRETLTWSAHLESEAERLAEAHFRSAGMRVEPLPSAVLNALRRARDEVNQDYAGRSPEFARLLASQEAFLRGGGQTAVAKATPSTPAVGSAPAPAAPAPRPQAPPVSTQAAGLRPRLFVLSVGVSRYADSALNLRYAAADAEAFGNSLRDQPKRIFSKVYLKTLTDAQASRETILESFSTFFGRAVSDDVVVIFVAGHGVKKVETNSFFFLPYGANQDNLITRGLSWYAFDEAVKILRSRVKNVVLVLDTCHAGGMQVAMRGVSAGQDLSAPFKREGMFVLAAAQASEQAQERSSWRHGAFTYALIGGLDGKADFDRDGYVDVVELFKYVERQVADMTDGRQHPHYRMSGGSLPLKALR